MIVALLAPAALLVIGVLWIWAVEIANAYSAGSGRTCASFFHDLWRVDACFDNFPRHGALVALVGLWDSSRLFPRVATEVVLRFVFAESSCARSGDWHALEDGIDGK